MKERRLFSTVEGHLGNAIQTVRDGDEIWIFRRATHPFILRRISAADAQKRFTFIGECYLHGAMYGEAFENKPPVWEEAWLV